MAINFNKLALGLRAVQVVFAIIVLGLTAYVINFIDTYSLYSVSQINFLLFNCVWTLFIAIPYLVAVPLVFPAAAHVYAILSVDSVTMIFWFAGFIAVSVFLPTSPSACKNSICESLTAATVIGAFSWLTFAVTTGFAVLSVIRFHSNNNQIPPVSTEMQTA